MHVILPDIRLGNDDGLFRFSSPFHFRCTSMLFRQLAQVDRETRGGFVSRREVLVDHGKAQHIAPPFLFQRSQHVGHVSVRYSDSHLCHVVTCRKCESS